VPAGIAPKIDAPTHIVGVAEQLADGSVLHENQYLVQHRVGLVVIDADEMISVAHDTFD